MRDDYSGNYILAPMNHIFQPEVTHGEALCAQSSSFPETTLGVPGRERDAPGARTLFTCTPRDPKDQSPQYL